MAATKEQLKELEVCTPRLEFHGDFLQIGPHFIGAQAVQAMQKACNSHDILLERRAKLWMPKKKSSMLAKR